MGAKSEDVTPVAPIGLDRFEQSHRPAWDSIVHVLMDDARRGLADVLAGRTFEADAAIAGLQDRPPAEK